MDNETTGTPEVSTTPQVTVENPATESDTPEEGLTNFEDISFEGELGGTEDEVKPQSEPQKAEPKAPESKVVEMPKPAAEPTQAPVPQQPVQQPPAEQPKPAAKTEPQAPPTQPTAQPPVTDGQPKPLSADEAKAKRQQAVDQVTSMYSMSDEEAAEFATAPEKILPKMVGRLFMDIFDAVYGTIMRQLPVVMQQQQQAGVARQELQSKFYTRWPGLKDPKYNNAIGQVMQQFHQFNPQATLDQAIEAVGTSVSSFFGLPLTASPVAPPAPAAAPPARPKPFSPANPGGSAPAAGGVAKNEFEELIAFQD